MPDKKGEDFFWYSFLVLLINATPLSIFYSLKILRNINCELLNGLLNTVEFILTWDSLPYIFAMFYYILFI